MNGLKPIKMPSAKEKVAAELRKAILSRQMKRRRDPFTRQCGISAECVGNAGKRSISDSGEGRADPASEE